MASQVHRGATEAELSHYLRNGLPSVLLAVVAITIAGYSHWFVSPVIQSRYEQICERNFVRLNLVQSGQENLLKGPPAVVQDGEIKTSTLLSPSNGSLIDGGKLTTDGMANANDLSDEEHLKLFEETQLCLRRLAISRPGDEVPRFNAAILAQAFADWYRFQAWELSVSEDKEDKVDQVADCLAGERYQLGKVTEALRSVERLDGTLAATATARIIERQIRETALTGGEELEDLADSAKQSHQRAIHDQSLAMVFAKTQVMEALEPSFKLTDAVRLTKLVEAARLLSSNASIPPDDLSWLALAELLVDREKALENSWTSVQEFWANSSSAKLRAADVDNVLRSMLVGGVFEEAESFVENQLKKLPSFEQADLRVLASASSLRQVIANHLIQCNQSETDLEGEKFEEGVSNDARLLDFAVRLRADSSSLVDFLIETAGTASEFDENDRPNSDRPCESLKSRMLRLLNDPKVDGLKQIVAAIGQSSGPDRDESSVRESIETVCRNDVAYGLLAMKVALALVGDGTGALQPASANASDIDNHMTPEMALVWLRTINETSPDLLDAWFARGNMHLAKGEKVEASECFSYLLDRLPDNSQVAEKLKEAKGP